MQSNDNIYVKEYFSPSPKSMSFQSSSLDDQISDENINEDMLFSAGDYNSVNNANLLKDIESLIQNMERKQTEDNDSTMLRNIDDILSNIKLNESRPHSPQSNISAEPIRMKSPIMLPSRNEDRAISDVQNILDEIRHFVALNIQNIVPDLVNQVELELTTDLHDEIGEISLLNLDDFLLNQREEGNSSSDEVENSQNAALEDFLRSRHEEEFEEGKISPATVIDDVDVGDDIHDFFLSRQEEEYDERNNNDFYDVENAIHAPTHDSITAPSGEDLIAAASSSNGVENENELAEGGEAKYVNEETNENEIARVETSNTDIVAYQQFEPLKYKSSYNLRILRQPAKRTKSERDFKKRNSLILENVLLGKTPIPSRKARPKSLALQSEATSVGNSQSVFEANDADSNINHHESLISENIESKSQPNLNEINVRRDIETRGDTESEINGNVQAGEENVSLLPFENGPNEATRTAIETTVVEVIINDEIEASSSFRMMNDVGVSQNVVNGTLPQSSSYASMPFESDHSKAPQNLSELVEDTQRLIKQMKDEINAIYVSDDELSYSEHTEYSEDWGDDFEGEEEYTDEEESEYEDWSGEFESEDAPDEIIIEETFIMGNNIDTGTRDNSEIPDIIIGDVPDAVNETENADLDGVVHGKLELTPMSLNQFKVDANIETGSDFAVGSFPNDNGVNLNNSTDLANSQEANEAPAGEIINNEIREATNSIKEIVNEAINDVISAISFDNVAQGNDNNYPGEIAGGLQQSNEHDSTIIDSAMNNSPNLMSEAMPKVSDANDDSITSGNLLNDDGNAGEIIIPLPQQQEHEEAASNAESENILLSKGDEESDQLKNDVAIENREEKENDESQKPLIIEANMAGTSSEESSNVAGVRERTSSTNLELIVNISEDFLERKSELISENIEERNTEIVATASVEQPNNEIASSSTQSNKIKELNSLEHSKDQTNSAEALEDSNQKPKGAIAKSKIPAKVKIVKRKNSTANEVDSQNSKSESSPPEKIKEVVKKQDNADAKSDPKQSTAGRKSSFDNSLRKKSAPTAFGVLGNSNVKNLQKEFLTKSNVAIATPPKTLPTKFKPSKLTPKKEPAPTFANKLTKLITPSLSAKNDSEKSADIQKEQHDHSKDVVPEKKYIEHCFSDEYPTTDDEQDEEMKTPKSFFIKKPPPSESDDETSDVRKTFRLYNRKNALLGVLFKNFHQLFLITS